MVEMVKEGLIRREEAHFEVITESMKPLIKPGNNLVVKDWQAKKLIMGDIVLYQDQHTLYAHRLLYKRFRGKQITLITKGDYSRTIDPPFLSECFLGKVIAIEKTGQRIELGAGLWRAFSWILAIYSLTEALLFRIVRKVIK